MEKESLRRLALAGRDAIPAERRKNLSEKIRKRVLSHPWYRHSPIVFSYASFRSEVETMELNRDILSDGKELYLPKTWVRPEGEKGMFFFRIRDLTELTRGYRGIPEPPETERFSPGEGEVLMLMPGVAYDGKGNRLGYGGGFYDHYLMERGGEITHTILLAYTAQKMEEIPAEDFDHVPDCVLTDMAGSVTAGL